MTDFLVCVGCFMGGLLAAAAALIMGREYRDQWEDDLGHGEE